MVRTTRRATRASNPPEIEEKKATSLVRSRSTRSVRSPEPISIVNPEIKANPRKRPGKTSISKPPFEESQPSKRPRRSIQKRTRPSSSTSSDEHLQDETTRLTKEKSDDGELEQEPKASRKTRNSTKKIPPPSSKATKTRISKKTNQAKSLEESQSEDELSLQVTATRTGKDPDQNNPDLQSQVDERDEDTQVDERAEDNQAPKLAGNDFENEESSDEHVQANPISAPQTKSEISNHQQNDLEMEDEEERENIETRKGQVEPSQFEEKLQDNPPPTPPNVSTTPVQHATPMKSPPPRRKPLTPMKLALEDLNRAGEPRLMIDRIVLVNFKSYAGRRVIGPFHKSFSAIVGPNGSGKSNTIDALLFVFGFKATKMRQGKLSELIHNSSASPPGGFESCSVEVWFKTIVDLDGPDDFEIVPNSKLVIARIATRSNTSKYTIDGKLSNFAEVTTLLKAKGIDLDHKRFLILQGEVESIAQMKPKAATVYEEGLLEYLEDIIGTNRFKEPIALTQQTLEEVAQKRSQQLERVKLVEREKIALGARKKVADEYLARMNTLVQQQNFLWQFYIHTGNTNLEKIRCSMDAIDNQLKENEAAHANDLQQNEALRVELEEEEGKYKEVEIETNALVKELGRKERELVSLTEKVKHGKTKQKKLKKSIAEDQHVLKEAAAIIHNGQEEIETLKAESEAKESLIEKEEMELDQIRDSLKDKTQVFTDQIELKQAELAPWAAQVTSKKAALNLAGSERDLLLKKATDFSSALNAAEEAVTKIEQEATAKKIELKTLKQEHAEYQMGIKGATTELKKLEQEESKLRSKLTTARQKADEAKILRSTSSSKSEVLKSLSKLNKQGRLPGFFGRLGDLGRIDDEYDVAISTACPQLDNLVCDTVETGQECLAHLKKTNAGRAVIICLDALKMAEPPGPPATPENAPRLVDLLTAKDSKFRAAFYHVLRDTLVAKDLAQANRIAFGNGSGKRWRVVTLDGKLIDSSGTMSGGGTRVARGLMASKTTSDMEITEEIVARLEKDTSKAETEMSRHLESRSVIQAELKRLQGELPKIEMRITKLEMDLAGSSKRMEEAKKTIAELGSEDRTGSNDDVEVKRLESIMKELDSELEHLQEKTGKIERSIKDLQEKILGVGGVKLRTQQVRVKDLKEMVEHTNNRLTKAEVARTKAERDTIKHEKTLQKSIAELQVLESELGELEAQINANSSETEAMKDTVEQARFALEEQKGRLMDIQMRRKEKLKIMNVFQLQQTELKQQREKAAATLAQSTANIAHWTQKQASLKLNLIEDDEVEEEEMERKEAEQVLKQYSAADFEDFDVELTKAEVAKLEEDQERASPDLEVLKEYAQREAEFMARAAELEATTRMREEAKQMLEDLNQQRLDEFMWGFQIISGKLKEMYQMITLGGNAELELVDSLDPFSEGIIFSVMPPKKSWKNISNLSGGEKTLSSLALVFALHAFKPTPLYFMDEIDAALDFRNVSIIGNYIKDRTKNAQFIIISLRNNMFELARRLVGIYKTSNCTKSIAVDNTELNEIC